MDFLSFMYVGIGGAVGSMARYGVMNLVGRFNATLFPFGTLAVNVLGGFLLGVWVALIALAFSGRARDLHLLFAVGLLGGFTTFSAFSMETYLLLERGLMVQTALYILASVGLSVAAFLAGMWCVRIALG